MKQELEKISKEFDVALYSLEIIVRWFNENPHIKKLFFDYVEHQIYLRNKDMSK